MREIATLTLIVQCDRDPYGTREGLDGRQLSPNKRVYWIADEPHGLKLRKRSGATGAEDFIAQRTRSWSSCRHGSEAVWIEVWSMSCGSDRLASANARRTSPMFRRRETTMAGSVTYTDPEITALMAERKALPANWQRLMRLAPKESQEERQMDLVGADANVYRLILRRNLINRLDFSLILAVRAPDSTRLFRLRRYNGATHRHQNRIERNRIHGFHIHVAIERYQARGMREDGFAEPTDRYFDFESARHCLFEDANIQLPPGQQTSLL